MKRDTPLFMYGTLMSGERLEDMVQTGPRRRATMAGRMHYHSPGIDYPVVVPNVFSNVAGEVGYVDISSRSFLTVALMELRAGYNLEWRLVKFDGHQSEFPALTFMWRHNDGVGAAIASGDWKDRHEMQTEPVVLGGSL